MFFQSILLCGTILGNARPMMLDGKFLQVSECLVKLSSSEHKFPFKYKKTLKRKGIRYYFHMSVYLNQTQLFHNYFLDFINTIIYNLMIFLNLLRNKALVSFIHFKVLWKFVYYYKS